MIRTIIAAVAAVAITKASAEPPAVDCGAILAMYSRCRDMPAQMACNEYYICASVFKNLESINDPAVCRTPDCGKNACALGFDQACDARDNGAHPYQPWGGGR